MRNDIDKNKDALQALEKAKEFILRIKADRNPEEFEVRDSQRRAKYNQIKREWVEGAMEWASRRSGFKKFAWDYEEDIIFDHDEDIHGTNKIELHDKWLAEKAQMDKKNRLAEGGATSLMRDRDRENKYAWMKANMNQAHWEKRFD